jgi:hypothetical protein
LKVAELNVDQIEMERSDFGEIGLDQIRIVLADIEPTASVEGGRIGAGYEARPVIDSSQEYMPAAGGKGAVDDADLLIGLARQDGVEDTDRAIDTIHLLLVNHEAEVERVVPVWEARDVDWGVAQFACGEVQPAGCAMTPDGPEMDHCRRLHRRGRGIQGWRDR